jgi:hypothetical protein
MDYNEFTRQVYGEDISTKAMVLPQLGREAGGTVSMRPLTATMGASARPASASAFVASSSSAVGSTFASSSSSSSLSARPGLPLARSASDHATALSGTSDERLSILELAKRTQAVKAKNLKVIESEAVKLARNSQRRTAILAERAQVQKKIAEVEAQREQIINDYKDRHPKPTDK